MKKLVRLWERPSYDGQKYTYYLIYYDPDGRRTQKALGHADKRKAEKQCAQLTRELRMETVEADSMRLSEFDVMTMAGHASFETTRRFYLAVRSDLLDRARKASSAALKLLPVAKLLQVQNDRGT